MKWLVGLFLVWIILRGRFDLYKDFASANEGKSEGEKAGSAAGSQLQRYLDMLEMAQ